VNAGVEEVYAKEKIMKTILYPVIIFLIFLAACGPSAETIALQTSIVATSAAAAWTEIPTNTLTPTETPRPTITPTPLLLVFIYQDDIPLSARKLQEEAARKSYLYLSQYADLGQITIYTFSDIEQYIDQIFPAIQSDVPTYSKSKFIQDWIIGGGGNTSAKDIVAISSGYFVWEDNSKLCYKAKNVAHEILHILQSKLLKHALFRPGLDYGPEWLKEGSAEVIGYKMADGLNGCDAERYGLADWVNDASADGALLKELEGSDAFDKLKFWAVAPWAVDYLTRVAPHGEKSLIEYYSEIGSGKSWRKAFELAFGFAVEEFYTDFEAARGRQEKMFILDSNVILDTSVCAPQSDNRVQCLGRKHNKDFIFGIPSIVTTPADQWKVNSDCAITGWGLEGSQQAEILQISVTDDTHGYCQVKVTFSADVQVTVDFVVP
jgi:hypothetical protein